ncbi:hypothetical protein [Pelagibacterium sp.]|uniref:hypothetical protein n=1 Tax=Pelagibacterium sp. TaxID=1967288 RepID=UPI003C7B0B5A
MRFFAMLRAAFATMALMVVRIVRESGRLVRRIVLMGSPPMPPLPYEIAEDAISAEAEREVPNKGVKMEPIRQLAASLAAGSVRPEQVEAVDPSIVEWLRVMPRPMLCRMACASDSAIDLHLHGGQAMKGVLAFDREAIANYDRPQPAPRRRYLRDVVDELGLMRTA